MARAGAAGTVWIDSNKQLSIGAPFGGFEMSGLGREKGIQGLRIYQQPKSIHWGLQSAGHRRSPPTRDRA